MAKSITLFNDKVARLHWKINDLDLYSRKQNMEINRLLEYLNENCKLVVGVLKHIDSIVTKDDLDLVHKIGKRNLRNGNKKIYHN